MFKSKQNGSIPALSMNTQEERKQYAPLKKIFICFTKKQREKMSYFINEWEGGTYHILALKLNEKKY